MVSAPSQLILDTFRLLSPGNGRRWNLLCRNSIVFTFLSWLTSYSLASSSQISDDTADSAESSGRDEAKTRTTPEDQDRKVLEGIQAFSQGKLSEAQILRIRLLNSLLMLRKHLVNYKECMISSLVYLDKLSQTDEETSSQSLNWWVAYFQTISQLFFANLLYCILTPHSVD